MLTNENEIIEAYQNIPPLPYKESWQPENKQWLKERKQKWRDYQSKRTDKHQMPREALKAEKHFFLTGEFPELAGIRYKNGHFVSMKLWDILQCHPLQTLDVWLALFDWAFEYEKKRFDEDEETIQKIIANAIGTILYDTDGLYNQQEALKLHKLAYGDRYRPEPFRYERGEFYGCPYHRVGWPITLTYAKGYYYRWIAKAEAYLKSEEFKPYLNFPLLEDLDYLASCLPYVDKSEFEFVVKDPYGSHQIRNPILNIMHLVLHFINPRAPINENTPEKEYAARLIDFFEHEVPDELKALWQYVQTESFTVRTMVEREPDFYYETEPQSEEPQRYYFDKFRSLTFNQIILQCEVLPRLKFFEIIYQCIADLGLTDESYNPDNISLVNIKGIRTDEDFITAMGYKPSQTVPAWRYSLKANKALLNINDVVIIHFEVLMVFPKEPGINPVFNLHQRPEMPFLWQHYDFDAYGELMSRQIKFILLQHPEFNCHEPDDDDLQFYISRDRIAQPKYDFPPYKGKNPPVWE